MLIAFHKPYGVISQFLPKGEWRTLAEFGLPPHVHPAGRLDADSEGLLLLTDDGALQHRLSDPRFEHPKTYWAQVEGAPTDAALAPLRAGIAIRDYVTRPAAVRVLDPPPEIAAREPPIRVRKHIPDRWIELVIREGRNRQVRRMTAAVGFPTLRLVRVAIGEIRLDGLAPGRWVEVPAPPR
ncbi:MAG TPA: pseudouridine synthase [Nannocystaceae bacterium]|nr:pseudouridine synthase [Nannocystaceae bacterium]